MTELSFKFLSHLGYYRILSRVPCAIIADTLMILIFFPYVIGKKGYIGKPFLRPVWFWFSGFMSSPALILEEPEVDNYSSCFLTSLSSSCQSHAFKAPQSSVTVGNPVTPRTSSSDSGNSGTPHCILFVVVVSLHS